MDPNTRLYLGLAAAGAVALLSACGHTEPDRATGGAAAGAATGAAVGLVAGPIGVPVGAAIGAGAGAVTGAATNPHQVALPPPPWSKNP